MQVAIGKVLNSAQIKFESLTHSYGVIPQGANGTCEYKFTNVGFEPLIIQYVSSSCGCAVTNWPKEPIMPGQFGAIKYYYDTKRIGAFLKTATITANINEPIILKACGFVYDPKIPERPQVSYNCDCNQVKSPIQSETKKILTDSVQMVSSAQLLVYPNPILSEAYFQMNKELVNANILMYNLAGQKVKEWNNIANQNLVFNRDGLPNGVYFIVVMQENKSVLTKKIVIAE